MFPYLIALLILVIAAAVVVYLLRALARKQQVCDEKLGLEKQVQVLEGEKQALMAQVDAQKMLYEERERQWAAAQEQMEKTRAQELQRMTQERLEAEARREKDREEAEAKREKELREIEAKREKERQELEARREKERQEAELRMAQERQEAREQIEKTRTEALEAMSKQMESRFRLLSEENSKVLRAKNDEAIGDLLKPIKEKFELYDAAVRASQDKATEQDASMRELIRNLMEQSKNVGDEAKNLANALMGHSKMQGDFGEMLLVDLLKNSGLKEGVHFQTQGVIRDEQGREVKSDEGKTMIPDVIVYYPDDTEVIVDSKVSLNAYVRYANAQTVEERSKYAKEHIQSVTNHIEELRSKDYASYIEEGRKKVDYNIMFIPVEGAFRLMLEEEPLLWQKAKDANVLIVSQMNLMILLNMIMLSWKRYDQEKNIQEVYATTQELMSQLRGWLESFVKLGNNLESAYEAYGDARKKLQTSNQSVFKKIAKLEKLKITPKRSNARLKVSARSNSGFESIIPTALVDESLALDETTAESHLIGDAE